MCSDARSDPGAAVTGRGPTARRAPIHLEGHARTNSYVVEKCQLLSVLAEVFGKQVIYHTSIAKFLDEQIGNMFVPLNIL
jgi:hypothetical protein